jgi:hypothetical protein
MSPSPKSQEFLTLAEVKDRFEDWRSSRSYISRIPDDLRSDAASLVERYSRADILRTLRLSAHQLKDFLSSEQKPRMTTQPTPSFLEFPLPSVPVPQSSYPVELQNAKGLTLRLQGCTDQQFSRLLQTFLQSS